MKDVSDVSVPTCKRQFMRFIGMVDYYRKFCNNFPVIAEPLTNLISKRTKFNWNNDFLKAFDVIKANKNKPVHLAPNCAKNLNWLLTQVILVQEAFCFKKVVIV